MRIIIADDYAVVRSGFSMILNFQDDMEVVATAADGIEAYTEVARHNPDVLLMDLNLPPGQNGLIATGRISEDFPDTKILILTMHDNEEYLFEVLKKWCFGLRIKKCARRRITVGYSQGATGWDIHPSANDDITRP